VFGKSKIPFLGFIFQVLISFFKIAMSFLITKKGHKQEDIHSLAPRSRSSSESSTNGDLISRTKSEEGRRSPGTIRIGGSRGNSRSNSDADATAEVILPGYSIANLKGSTETSSEITFSTEHREEETVVFSATTAAKVEAMKMYLADYYWGLFDFLHDRETRYSKFHFEI
jgi:hypothetical protein